MARDEPVVIELHGARTGNCLRVAITLEEMEIPYKVIRVNLREGAQRDAKYLKLNPAGKVPTIVDRTVGGSPFVLTQSNAIMLHLAEKSPGRLLPVDDIAERGIAHERLFYFLMDVIAPSHGAFMLQVVNEESGAVILDGRATAMLVAAERFLETGLFMAGERFTLADIAALTMSLAYEEVVDWPAFPRLHRWYADVRRRPAVEKGLHAFDKPSA